jgi:hypothetical protein
MFSAEEDELIAFPSGDAEQPRLYFAPEVINQEFCRMLQARSHGPAPDVEAVPMKMARLSAGPPASRRGYEWPIR